VGGGECGSDNTCHYVSGCVPHTCEKAKANCGDITDGCGGVLNCDTLGGGGPFGCPFDHFKDRIYCYGDPPHCVSLLVPVFQQCDGTGTANVCGFGSDPPPPTTCAAQQKNCGFISNGVDGVIDCGTCADGEACGGGGNANVCAIRETGYGQLHARDLTPPESPLAAPSGAAPVQGASCAAGRPLGAVRESTGGPLALLALSLLALGGWSRRRRPPL
jgi:hypothetical protein